jgi:hypothetical protein
MRRERVVRIRRNGDFATQPDAKAPSEAACRSVVVVAIVVMVSSSDVP